MNDPLTFSFIIYNMNKRFACLVATMITLQTAWLFLYIQNIVVYMKHAFPFLYEKV